MPHDQVTVLGRHQVRLDKVGAELDGQRVAFERVLGQIAARTAVADLQRRLRRRSPMPVLPSLGRGSRCREASQAGDQGQRRDAGSQKLDHGVLCE